jgi:hypothetical protein
MSELNFKATKLKVAKFGVVFLLGKWSSHSNSQKQKVFFIVNCNALYLNLNLFQTGFMTQTGDHQNTFNLIETFNIEIKNKTGDHQNTVSF